MTTGELLEERQRRGRAQIEFWVPALPMRALSANGGGRSRRNPWDLSEAKNALGDVTYHALLAKFAPDMPVLTPPVTILVTLYARHGTKNKDGLYRPTDPFNIGGDVSKPVVDQVVKLGIIPDDSYLHVDMGGIRVRHVDHLEDEGISVCITEVGGEA